MIFRLLHNGKAFQTGLAFALANLIVLPAPNSGDASR
jgi:hypothetical protein